MSIAFSPNGILLASASFDRTVKLWDTTTGQCLWTLEGYIKGVISIACSYNCTLVVSAALDETVKL